MEYQTYRAEITRKGNPEIWRKLADATGNRKHTIFCWVHNEETHEETLTGCEWSEGTRNTYQWLRSDYRVLPIRHLPTKSANDLGDTMWSGPHRIATVSNDGVILQGGTFCGKKAHLTLIGTFEGFRSLGIGFQVTEEPQVCTPVQL